MSLSPLDNQEPGITIMIADKKDNDDMTSEQYRPKSQVESESIVAPRKVVLNYLTITEKQLREVKPFTRSRCLQQAHIALPIAPVCYYCRYPGMLTYRYSYHSGKRSFDICRSADR